MVAAFRKGSNKNKCTAGNQISLKPGWRRTNMYIVEKKDIGKMNAHNANRKKGQVLSLTGSD